MLEVDRDIDDYFSVRCPFSSTIVWNYYTEIAAFLSNCFQNLLIEVDWCMVIHIVLDTVIQDADQVETWLVQIWNALPLDFCSTFVSLSCSPSKVVTEWFIFYYPHCTYFVSTCCRWRCYSTGNWHSGALLLKRTTADVPHQSRSIDVRVVVLPCIYTLSLSVLPQSSICTIDYWD